MRPYEQQVRAGVTYLNQQLPDWFGRIDLSILDLGGADTCVLAQLFTDYCDAADEIDQEGQCRYALGFSLLGAHHDDSAFVELTREWNYQILQLRR